MVVGIWQEEIFAEANPPLSNSWSRHRLSWDKLHHALLMTITCLSNVISVYTANSQFIKRNQQGWGRAVPIIRIKLGSSIKASICLDFMRGPVKYSWSCELQGQPEQHRFPTTPILPPFTAASGQGFPLAEQSLNWKALILSPDCQQRYTLVILQQKWGGGV